MDVTGNALNQKVGSQSQLLMNRLRLAPGAEWELTEPGWTFVAVLKGEAYLLGKGTALSCPTGSLVVVAGPDRFELRASRIGGVQVDWFRLDPSSIFGVFTLPERSRLERPEACQPPLPWVLPPEHSAAELMGACADDASRGALDQRARVLQVVSKAIFPELSPPPESHPGLPDAGDRLMALVHQMTDAELLSMKPDALAELCRCERRRMLLIFREKLGESFPGRQEEWRRVKACRLLSLPGASVTVVAKECGYEDPDAFRAWFRRQFGKPPAQWIKDFSMGNTSKNENLGDNLASASSPERHDSDNRP